MKTTIIVSSILLLSACADAPCEQKFGYYVDDDLARYTLDGAETTPLGVRVVRSGQDVALDDVDSAVGAVLGCLGEPAFAGGVVIAPDWETSACTGEQVLPIETFAAGCVAKGEGDLTCPCRYRAIVKCPDILVVTPNLKLLGDVLVRCTMETTNPWADPKLAACASLSVR